MAYTTTALIADIKLRAFAPTDQKTFEETDILLLADAEMQTTVLPLMQALRAEYYVATKDRVITSGTAAYAIPVRAIGMQLRDVQLVFPSGEVRDLPRIDPEQVKTTAVSETEAFYIRGNKVVLYPTPDATTALATLRMSYYLRPGKLVLSTSVAQIATITAVDDTVTVASVPSAWTTADTFDFVKRDGGSEQLGTDYTASSVSTTIIFGADLPTDLEVGDYVCLAGETIIPQIPAEMRPVLAQAVAAQMLGNQKLPGYDDAMKRLDMEVKAATALLTPRVTGATVKIVPRHGWL